jgi:hypothetical protein
MLKPYPKNPIISINYETYGKGFVMITSANATKKYNTAILNLFELILKLSEKQQHVLLKFTEHLFIKEKRTIDRKSCHIPI